jgi:hypothetical protein
LQTFDFTKQNGNFTFSRYKKEEFLQKLWIFDDFFDDTLSEKGKVTTLLYSGILKN